jgi:hypothetical protein
MCRSYVISKLDLSPLFLISNSAILISRSPNIGLEWFLFLVSLLKGVVCTVCRDVGLPRAQTRTIIAHSHTQPCSTRATQLHWARRAKQLRWALAHAASQPSGRAPAIDIARLIARFYPPACLPTQKTS